METLLEFERGSRSIVAASSGYSRISPVVSRGCTKRIQFDGITITGVMSENNEISLNHRDPLRIHPSAFHHAPPPPLFLPPRTREKREHVPPNQFRYSAHYRATSETKQRLNQPARPRSILPSRILFFRKPRNTRIYMYVCTNRGSLSRCYIIIEDLEINTINVNYKRSSQAR